MILYLFDIDGTILLSGGAGGRALDRVFRERYGIDGAMNQVRPNGMTDPVIVEEIFQTRLGRSPRPDEIDAVLETYVPYLREEVARSTRFRLMPNVVEAIDYLAGQPGVAIGLATGNIQLGARVKLERAALWERFAFGGFGCDAANRAVVVARAIERGIAHAGRPFATDRIVVVGDTTRDIDAARANGIKVVVVANQSSDERAALSAYSPDAVFDTLAELPDWHRTITR
jgi:phosphoglycolate phosphatase-like HAD superfamily hydrolase